MRKYAVGFILFLWGITFLKIPVAAQDLQALIDQAPPHSVLTLEGATYFGPITIDKPIVIQGTKETKIVGNYTGNVVTITANQVKLQNLSIQNSGQSLEDAAILIESSNEVTIEQVHLSETQRGIFIRGGFGHQLLNNEVISFPVHYSKRGNAIHLLNTKKANVQGNRFYAVQDGVYLDEAYDTTIHKNDISDARYAIHFMFSSGGVATENHLHNNVNGVMAMNSEGVLLQANRIEKQMTYRGYGILAYDMEDVMIEDNTIIHNHHAVEVQASRGVEVTSNTIAGNYVGLSSSGDNQQVVVHQNYFSGNIVQTKLSGTPIQLDNGGRGNLWDDYTGFDLTGDGIGELPYDTDSGTMSWMDKYPHLQFYFESPAFHLWNRLEKMFRKSSILQDRYPLTETKR